MVFIKQQKTSLYLVSSDSETPKIFSKLMFMLQKYLLYGLLPFIKMSAGLMICSSNAFSKPPNELIFLQTYLILTTGERADYFLIDLVFITFPAKSI